VDGQHRLPLGQRTRHGGRRLIRFSDRSFHGSASAGRGPHGDEGDVRS
jgi:hypothetical protein